MVLGALGAVFAGAGGSQTKFVAGKKKRGAQEKCKTNGNPHGIATSFAFVLGAPPSSIDVGLLSFSVSGVGLLSFSVSGVGLLSFVFGDVRCVAFV